MPKLPKCSGARPAPELGGIPGDDRQRLAATFGARWRLATWSFPAAASATRRTTTPGRRCGGARRRLELHAEAFEELKIRFAGEEITDRRKLLVTFPQGVQMIPNLFNRIAGFMANEHYFVPVFPRWRTR